jgi:hypothetical protein
MTPPTITVKIAFLLDCTGSMEPWIHQAKTRMVELVDRVREQHPRARVLVSFVGYRDYGDAEQMVEFPFDNAQTTMNAIRGVQADGGDDQAEDVVHALFRAVHQDWTDADVKIVFHIADAPAHGREFHTLRVSDRFPRGDPHGLDPRDFVEKLSFLNVHYTFVRIHDSTDTMLEQFHNCYAQGGTFSVIDLLNQRTRTRNPEVLSEALTRSITDSITQHCTTSRAL